MRIVYDKHVLNKSWNMRKMKENNVCYMRHTKITMVQPIIAS